MLGVPGNLSECALFIVVTAYTSRTSSMILYHAINKMMTGLRGTITTGELVTTEQSAGRVISNATFTRWVDSQVMLE